ncbi:hypothetical protein GCM10009714_09430 [Microlunatus capsulatus]
MGRLGWGLYATFGAFAAVYGGALPAARRWRTQADIPERVIGADPDAWYQGDPATMGEADHAEWRRAMRDPHVVRGMLEDYRAGLTVDYADEVADRAAGRRFTQPLLVLWSALDDLEQLYGDPLVIWRAWPTRSPDTESTPPTTWPNRHPPNSSRASLRF